MNTNEGQDADEVSLESLILRAVIQQTYCAIKRSQLLTFIF